MRDTGWGQGHRIEHYHSLSCFGGSGGFSVRRLYQHRHQSTFIFTFISTFSIFSSGIKHGAATEFSRFYAHRSGRESTRGSAAVVIRACRQPHQQLTSVFLYGKESTRGSAAVFVRACRNPHQQLTIVFLYERESTRGSAIVVVRASRNPHQQISGVSLLCSLFGVRYRCYARSSLAPLLGLWRRSGCG